MQQDIRNRIFGEAKHFNPSSQNFLMPYKFVLWQRICGLTNWNMRSHSNSLKQLKPRLDPNSYQLIISERLINNVRESSNKFRRTRACWQSLGKSSCDTHLFSRLFLTSQNAWKQRWKASIYHFSKIRAVLVEFASLEPRWCLNSAADPGCKVPTITGEADKLASINCNLRD